MAEPFTVVEADQVYDVYAGTDVPGEFRPLTDALGAEQVAITLIRVPPHCDFEQGTGHHHREIEEIYLVARGTPTMPDLRPGRDLRFPRYPMEMSDSASVRAIEVLAGLGGCLPEVVDLGAAIAIARTRDRP